MNKNDKVQIARIDERVKFMQKSFDSKSKDMHDDIKEIINTMKTIKGCIRNNELSITKIDTKFANHINRHSVDVQISKRNWAAISGFAALISAGIAGLSLLIVTIIT